MNILFSIDENVVEQLKKTIFSIKLHNDIDINVYIIHENLKQSHINSLKEYVESNNLATLHFIKYNIKNIKLPISIKHITKATYLKLFAPYLIEEDIDRILYLDYDIVCDNNIFDFYFSDFEGNTLIGIEDFYLNTIIPNYINAGVYLIDLYKYKEKYTLEDFINYIEDNYDNLEYQDQTIINEMFKDDIKIADPYYNFQTNAVYPNDDYVNIVHYANKEKPWNDDYSFPIKALPYYKLLYQMGEEDEAVRLSQLHFKNEFELLFKPENYNQTATLDVIIPSYNQTKTIRATLDSILEQKLFNIKLTVLLIDDCSEEDYQPVFNEYKNKLNIKYFRMERNSGVALARQRGIDEGDGDFFTIIDSDDRFISPYALATMYFSMMDSNADVVRTVFFEEKNYDLQTYKLYRDDNIACHGKLYRKQFIKDNNIIYLDLRGNEDTAYNALLKACNAKYHDVIVMTYRWCYNPNSFTRGDEFYHEKDLITFAKGFVWTAEEIMKRKDYIGDVPTKIAEIIASVAKRIRDCWYEETKDELYHNTSKVYFNYRLVEEEPLYNLIVYKYGVVDDYFVLNEFLPRLQEEMYMLEEYQQLSQEDRIKLGELFIKNESGVTKTIEEDIMETNDLIEIGSSSYIRGPINFENFKGKLYIGNYCYIESNLTVSGSSDIYIGDNSKIDKNVSIFTNRTSINSYYRDYIYTKKIYIRENVFIGRGSILYPGAIVNNNSYIEAGSILTCSIEENVYAAGNPCEKKRYLYEFDDKFYDRDKKIRTINE